MITDIRHLQLLEQFCMRLSGTPLPPVRESTVKYPGDFDELPVANYAAFARLPPATRVAYCIHRLEAEVNNGGLYQFFSNSTGQYVRETIQALIDIGAPKTGDLLARAAEICFPGGYPSDASQYQTLLAEYGEVAELVEPLDVKFLAYEEPLSKLVNEYLGTASV
ncbi:MAG: DMP19 family protein [Rhodanobacteraceae bacterium]|nr:DMP19 family protein [Rhodanobacteraceae bacterium]